MNHLKSRLVKTIQIYLFIAFSRRKCSQNAMIISQNHQEKKADYSPKLPIPTIIVRRDNTGQRQ